RRFLAIFRQAAQNESGADADWGEARAFLEDLSRTRARQGFSPSETATFVFSLKQPLFARLRQDLGRDPDALAGEMWSTAVAQHLLKTVAAARLMGADCIISGIRPQIAQTIVHLGVDLNAVTTKATLADAFAVALQRTGFAVTRAASARSASPAKH